MPENAPDFVSQNEKAKSALVVQIARLVRKAGLDYDGWRYVAKRVREACDLTPAKKGRKLPRVLTAEEFRKFYAVVDRADDVQHALMLRLLFFTAVRVSELCGIAVADVDLEQCKIRVNRGKGAKDRYVLFGKSFATARGPMSRPTRTTAGCSRPGGTAGSRPGGSSRWSSSTPSGPGCGRPRTRSGTRRSPG